MLGGLDPSVHRTVVADLAAGLVSVVLASAGAPPDVLVVVAEPYARSGEVASRLLAFAAAQAIPHTLLVANRVDADADLAALRGFLGGAEPDVVMPTDPGVAEADRLGLAPVDHAPTGPTVSAVGDLAARLRALAVATSTPTG